MSTAPLDVLLAAAPPLAVLILMVGFRWGGSKAGPVGWLVALGLAIVYFGAGGELLAWAHVRSLVRTWDVVYIVWMALALYFVVKQAGALEVIAEWFTDLTGDDVLRVLLLGWVFTSFLQGVGGFGVPVAIVAPLLVGLGLSPLAAVVVPSIGHAWAVTFGSLGSSFLAMLNATDDLMEAEGLTPAADLLAPPAAVLLGVSAITCGLLVAHAYAGKRGVKRAFPAVMAIGTVMAVVQYIIATNGLWNIGAASAGLAGLVVGLWVTRWPMYKNAKPKEIPNGEEADDVQDNRPVPTFPLAIAGYAVLVALAVLIVGVAPIKEIFAETNILIDAPALETSDGWAVKESTLKLRLFGHTGAVLLYSALIAFILYRAKGYYKNGAGKEIVQSVRKKGTNPAIGILSMVAMATIMADSGMTQTLAIWFGEIIPSDLYAFVATAIGTLGAFMTGSNTNSNVVFSDLQMRTAMELGLSVTMVLGIQTASSAIASLLAPAKIMVGASTVGMSGDEGTVLRHLLLYGGALLLVIATLGFIFLQLGY
jgi:lactate permease